MKERIKQMIILGIKHFKDPYFQGITAEISFYLFLSIAPLLLLLTQFLGLFHVSLQEAVGWISMYTGKEASEMILSLTKFSSAGFANVIYIGIALWSSSQAQFTITRVNNYIFTDGENTGRGYWRERLRAIRTVMITLFTVAFAIIILAFGDLLLASILGILEVDPPPYFDTIWTVVRWILGLALYFLMISYNYYILPTVKVSFRKIVPGSIFASVGLLLVTFVYSKYTTNIANYDILYGALSSIVAILLWFNFLSWVLLLGMLFNKMWNDTANQDGN